MPNDVCAMICGFSRCGFADFMDLVTAMQHCAGHKSVKLWKIPRGEGRSGSESVFLGGG